MTSVGRLVVALCLAALWACAEDPATSLADRFTVTLVNEVGEPLVPYVVAAPPARRAADPAGVVPADGRTSLDPTGSDAVYYAEEARLGFTVELALDETPARVTVRTARYQVPPGDAASDPTRAPMALLDQTFRPRSETFTLVVRRTLEGLLVALEDN